jgi:hypothetical protein
VSADVIPLRAREPEGPYLSGRARCLDCGHEWEASAPVGTVHLECPKCTTSKGVMRGPVGGDVGEAEWTCNCGGDVFKIVARKDGTFKGICCLRCGAHQTFR